VLIVTSRTLFPDRDATAVISSMGASAVLLFGIPHGPLSQPWPVLAGQGISALIGVSCARWIPDPALAAGCAVGLSIGAMLQLKCVHPPGGATAFTAVIGGSAIRDLGYQFVLVPVLANALCMVLLAVVLNNVFYWRRYPAYLTARPPAPVQQSKSAEPLPSHEEILTAVRTLDSFVDISEEDLLQLLELLLHPSVKR
jgi:CBS domain-containing membrane protein